MYEQASQVASDAISSIRTVASFSAEKRMMDAYRKKCEAPMKHGIRQGLASGLGFGFSFMTLYFTYALCFYVGARFVKDGKATFTEVFRVSTREHGSLDCSVFFFVCFISPLLKCRSSLP